MPMSGTFDDTDFSRKRISLPKQPTHARSLAIFIFSSALSEIRSKDLESGNSHRDIMCLQPSKDRAVLLTQQFSDIVLELNLAPNSHEVFDVHDDLTLTRIFGAKTKLPAIVFVDSIKLCCRLFEMNFGNREE